MRLHIKEGFEMPTKRHLPLKDFFLLLCSLKNIVGWVQNPRGGALKRFLAEKTGLSQLTISQKIDRLAELKYIEKEFRGPQGGFLWRVKILTDSWDETRLIEKPRAKRVARMPITKTHTTPKPELEASQPANIGLGESTKDTPLPINELPKPAKPQEKRFAVFMDYKNLEMNLPKSTDKFRNFSWLLDPILKQGKIIFAFVFIPDHYVSRAPIMQLTHKHHFHAIFCPRQISGVITKDADTVDAQMHDLGCAIIDHSDVTDLIIVSGDADFQRLITHAIWQQKSVIVRSAPNATSGRFLEMQKDGSISVQLVS